MAWYRGARRPLDEAEKSTDAAKARARAMELLAGQEMAAAVVAEMVERSMSSGGPWPAGGEKSDRTCAEPPQIEQALDTVYAADETGEDPELEAAAALVAEMDLVVAALMRRGFAYPVIRDAIRRVEQE